MKFKPNRKEYTVTKVSMQDKNFEDDYVVKTIGGFGRFQAIVCIITASLRFILAVNTMSINFLTPRTEFECVKFKNGADTEVQNSTCYDDCLEYVYHNGIFEDNLISRFGLICDDKWLASFTQSMMMFGCVFGVSIFGWISDRFGRRTACLLSTSIAVVFMIAAPFSSSYWMFTTLRFLAGTGSGGIMTLSPIISMESVGPQYKDTIGSLNLFPDGISQMIITVLAFYCSTWQSFLLVCGLFSVLLLLALLFVPESPRWLISQKKGDEAISTLTRAAKFNNLSTTGIKDVVNKTLEDLEKNKIELQKYTYFDLFRTRKLATITIASIIIWIVGGISFYGINQYASLIGSNIYVVVPILGGLQLLATVVAILVNKHVKRKLAVILVYLMIGTSMFVIIFIPLGHWGCTVASSIGLGSATLLFSIIYVQMSELYPTPLRNMGFGLSSAGSKFGAMIAPFIANTKPYWLASSIFAALCIFAMAVCLLLPETKGNKLQDTVD